MLFENIFYSRIINFLILFFFLLFFQSLISDWITILGARLDLGIFILVYLALNYSANEAVIFGFIWGILLDVLNPSLLGLGTLIKVLLGFALANFKSQLYFETSLPRALIIFGAVIFNELVYNLVALNGNFTSLANIFFRVTLPSALYTSLVGSLFWLWRDKTRTLKAGVQ